MPGSMENANRVPCAMTDQGPPPTCLEHPSAAGANRYSSTIPSAYVATLIWKGMGLDRHPDLLPMMFGNYEKVIYLAQTDDPALETKARVAARRLGLAFEMRKTGYGDLAGFLAGAAKA